MARLWQNNLTAYELITVISLTYEGEGGVAIGKD